MKQTILKTENFNEILKFANKEDSFFQEERLFVLLRFFEMKGTKGIERYRYTIVKKHENICELSCGWNWHEEALELVEEKVIEQIGEYFYVGQTVYSPYFKNEERKGLVESIDLKVAFSIKCIVEEIYYTFNLKGEFNANDNFISLFQKPIIFPTNKPIVTYKKDEVVEVTNGKYWRLAYYSKPSNDKTFPHSVFLDKLNDEYDSQENYHQIRKVKTL